MEYPLVSVIIPCFNCEKFIIDALDSIFFQNYENIEVVIVDDGSTDQSCSIIKNYPKTLNLLHQNNQGPAAARNTGVKHSKGSLIAFLDADDVWLPKKLKVQVDLILKNKDIDIIFGTFGRIDTKTNYKSLIQSHQYNNLTTQDTSYPEWIYHKMLLDSCIHIITALINRSLFEELNGFDVQLKTGEDYDFWLRATQKTKVIKLNKAVSLYRENPESTTHVLRDENNEEKALLKAIKKFGLTSPSGQTVSKKEMDARMYELNFRHAYLHFKNNSYCTAKRYFIKSFAYKSNFKLIIYIFLSYYYCLIKQKEDTC